MISYQKIADIFNRIANLMEIKGEVIYKVIAYRKAADNIHNLTEDLYILQQEGRLTEIPGVGKAIAKKIDEILSTGKLDFFDKLEQEVPATLIELLEVPDLGPKKAALFWKQAGITTLAKLETAARQGQLRDLPGMGRKSEARLLAGIEALSRRSQRMLLGNARPVAQSWLKWLTDMPAVQQAEVGGSIRRWRDTIGDIDLVVASYHPADIMESFINHPEIERVLNQGENKSSVELNDGLNIQLWIQPPERFGSLLQFVTGAKDHNIGLRELAQRQGLSLSERGFVNDEGNERLCATEEEVYSALGLTWIPPELREDRGEIKAARTGHLPHLMELGDLQADLHTHSLWSDGSASIQTMAEEAQQRGLKVLAITDHSRGLGVAGGLSIERLRQQRIEVESIKQQIGEDFHLLHGIEVEIRSDGTLDYPDEVLAELDIVIASLHINLRQPREKITRRLLRAMRNPNVDIIGHPSGRLLPNREGADLDWEAVFDTAYETGVALEINSHPSRLDLDDIHARRAAELGILLSIGSDAHAPEHIDLLRYGVAVARRAWVGLDHVIGAWPAERLLDWLKDRKSSRLN